jgi:hypothetical protein
MTAPISVYNIILCRKLIATNLYKEMERPHLTSLNMFFHSYSCELPTFNDLIGSCSLVGNHNG